MPKRQEFTAEVAVTAEKSEIENGCIERTH
jgi:hypothetical protein